MRRGSARGPVDNKRFYELLGVERDAGENELKKAYRKLAVQHHPDKGGNVETFQEISHAFEVLSDPEKRQVYDTYGEQALKEGAGAGGGFHDANDIFEAMFGGGLFGGGGSRRSRGPRKSEDVQYPIKVTLTDLYKGKTAKLAITRHRVCAGCKGKGAASADAVSSCMECGGKGIRVQFRQVGPGMVQQVQSVCASCSGAGEIIPESARCGTCKGQKVVKERKVLEVFIDPGMQDGQRITFAGEADEEPNCLAGDVIIVVQQQQHPVFERKGRNLLMTRDIPLVDALCGVEFTVKHLDGRDIVIRSSPGDIIKSDDIKAIAGEGMPTWKSPFDKGFMFVKFNVVYPTSVSKEQSALLQKVLGPVSRVLPVPAHADECQMSDFHPGMERDAYVNGDGTSMDEGDEDDGRGGQRVQCAQS
uniref:Uncharacterized protein n=1 Tax=Erythrolobus australicus TaxID=1077150 RepID=A0A7S1TPG6_9RHOD|eukprot:CAMPEP_0185833544 /NCGR_PEP_ID=MMETSP1353-20130828/3027_1 /TAXON_ID=1077150 /ORGANISM="Erythrolobus australicus, Strain CCMP3124" /LENGTH=417 /DNA_ID=CAMNT_0028531851 /DNA_START=10 /DNA_END=1263 /DNA_ORIENTATION=-